MLRLPSSTPPQARQEPGNMHPTTPMMQPLAGITHHRFSPIRFRSPLLTESLLFSLPEGTEMFHFPPFPPHTLYIQVRVTALDKQRGFPIRTPSDQHPVIDSPRLIADSHVLHRLLVPRHPPCALNNLATHNDHYKTQQEKPPDTTRHNIQQHLTATHCKTRPPRSPPHNMAATPETKDARVHYTVLKQQPTPPPHTQPLTTHAIRGQRARSHGQAPEAHCLKTQQCTLFTAPNPHHQARVRHTMSAFHP